MSASLIKVPQGTGRKLVLAALGATAAGAAAALATNEELRNRVLGSAKALGDEIIGSEAAPEPK